MPNEWYPAQNWLSLMNELAENPNYTSNLVAIGMSIPKKVPLPPEMENATLSDMLEMWDAVYQMQHRNGDVGSIKAKKVADKHYEVSFHDLYPDDLSYGITYGWCQRFLPTGTHFKVSYKDIFNRRDMNDGDSTTIVVTW